MADDRRIGLRLRRRLLASTAGFGGIRPVVVAVMVLALSFAGCAGPTSGSGNTSASPARTAAAALVWPSMNVALTPTEQEPPGTIQLTWSGADFAASAEHEKGLSREMVVRDGIAYTTDAGMGWTRYDLARDLAARQANPVWVLWDLRQLLASPSLTISQTSTGSASNFTATGTFPLAGTNYGIDLRVRAEAGVVTSARLASSQVAESPFTFTRASAAFPFSIEVPQVALDAAAVRSGNLAANAGHYQLIRLIQNYTKDHGGQLPDKIAADPTDPQSVYLEHAASGAAWPDDAFGGGPMHDEKSSGNFSWTRCSPTDGQYQGWGWDGALRVQYFGNGCR
jgi:hypothetical protein